MSRMEKNGKHKKNTTECNKNFNIQQDIYSSRRHYSFAIVNAVAILW